MAPLPDSVVQSARVQSGRMESASVKRHAEAVREAFAREGFVYVRGAVGRETMDALREQLEREIAAPSIPPESGEVGTEPIELARPASWPRASTRRVVEVTPPGDTAAWRALVSSPPLTAALDALLGPGDWELPINSGPPAGGGRIPVRHWYAPIVFPEDAGAPAWSPVNRRGQRWRGWHVDIGPGFSTDERRTLAGHRYQGCVLLVLGSACEPGGGGTALIRGSHRWVYAALRAAGEGGVTHQELNGWSSREAAARRRVGALSLDYELEGSGGGSSARARVHQVCGAIGDAVLLHPWLVHSGTANCSAVPRVMYNGMARVSERAFADHGCRALRLLGLGEAEAELATAAEEAPEATAPALAPAPAAAATAAGEASGAKQRARGSAGSDLELLEPPPKRRPLRSAQALADEVAQLAAAAELRPTRPSARGVLSAHGAPHAALGHGTELPRVSVIVPAHNALGTLDECLASVLAQTYPGPLEVSIFDDASDDGTDAAVRRWAERLRRAGVAAVVSGSRWGGDASASAGGIGFAKNAAVRQSSGAVLLFLDADDIMLPTRIHAQVSALASHPRAIVGGAWRRLPDGATAHYETWANGLPPLELWLQQFRETTVQMPTWCMARATFERCGGFLCAPAEDLDFMHKQLDSYRHLLRAAPPAPDGAGAAQGAAAAAAEEDDAGAAPEGGGGAAWRARLERALAADPPLLRVGSPSEPVLLYRWTASSMTSTVSRRCLLGVRVAAFERRVLELPEWRTFTVWGAGRDGKHFVSALSAEARARIVALADIDPKRVGTTYCNHALRPAFKAPVVHAREIRGPTVVCVALRRADESASVTSASAGAPCELRRAAAELGLVEGRTLWYFF